MKKGLLAMLLTFLSLLFIVSINNTFAETISEPLADSQGLPIPLTATSSLDPSAT
jgi:hypothetical protein